MAKEKRSIATYRSVRRLIWRAIPGANRPSWAEFNSKRPTPNPYHIRTPRPQYWPVQVRGRQYPAGSEGPVRRAARLAAAKPARKSRAKVVS